MPRSRATSSLRPLLVALAATLAASSAGCKFGGPTASKSAAKGQVGVSYIVLVGRQEHGTVRSMDGQIDCGPGATACSASFPWSTAVVLSATPSPGYALTWWAGDCKGTTAPTCTLDTAGAGADKYAVPVFEAIDSRGHGDWTSPAIHGLGFFDFAGHVPGALQCTNCHGAAYDGAGIAPSCNSCHAAAGWADWRTNCSFCHGAKTPESKAGYGVAAHPTWAAPPDDVVGRLGGTGNPARSGAHAAHLTGATTGGPSFSAPLQCATCHQVPTDLSHIGGSVSRATVALSGAGQAFLPSNLGAYNPATGTCATYCHGPTASPPWSGSGVQCGSCHGLPPSTASGHPAVSSALTGCATCHPDTMNADGTLNVAAGKHLDGLLQVTGGASCTSCHGDATRAPAIAAAPPRDAHGNTATTAVGVGAHQRHLVAGVLSPAIACTECHTPPQGLAGHPTGTVVMTFGALARTAGATATWNGATCANYCHGATLSGGTNKAPSWTTVDGSQAACGTCHGAPPPAPHVQSTDCGACHGGYTSTTVNLATHLNGSVQVNAQTCTSCHGDAARAGVAGADPYVKAAPPVDATGNAATTALGVGAHQSHLNPGAGMTSAPIACSECHVVPASTQHSNGAVEVTFGAKARTQSAAPVWNRQTASCASTYCHGSTLNAGGTNHAPVWTVVDGTQASCGTCHGAPPPDPHPQSTACGSCHAGYTATTVNPATHVDGQVQVSGSLTCTSCHGDAARALVVGADPSGKAAPPSDTAGNTATSALGVGAHAAHVNAGSTVLAAPIACAECHVVPQSTGHSNGAVDVTFGALSTSGGTGATWNRQAATCANYCHGATLGGGTNKAPRWTGGPSQAACGTCHGAPPPAPHSQSTSCGGCHAGYTATSVNPVTHVDGQLQVSSLSCTSCHGDAARTAVAGADANVKAAPPVDTTGDTATTARGVGAHAAHVNAATVMAPVACAQCHVVPGATAHSNGSVDMSFGALARTGGTAATWNGATCTNYCHGATLPGGTNKAPSWTGGASQATCSTCHGLPPTSGQHGRSNHSGRSCGDCHGGSYTRTAADPSRHVNGSVELGNRITSWDGRNCTSSCHGGETW